MVVQSLFFSPNAPTSVSGKLQILGTLGLRELKDVQFVDAATVTPLSARDASTGSDDQPSSSSGPGGNYSIGGRDKGDEESEMSPDLSDAENSDESNSRS